MICQTIGGISELATAVSVVLFPPLVGGDASYRGEQAEISNRLANATAQWDFMLSKLPEKMVTIKPVNGTIKHTRQAVSSGSL